MTDPAYHPETPILSLGPTFWDPVAAADFPATTLRFRNDRAAAEIGLAGLSDAEWIAYFARFQPLPGNLPEPLALRYHGHQFRSYNPDLGDGRGFTFAQARGRDGRLLDLGTKGSGQTPWSRFGDGRLTLKGGVREVLATEMLQTLGVSTSRSLSLVETGEALERGDEPSPTRSAVLVRLSHGHVRIGTFQRLAYERDADAMRRLVAYALRELYGKGGDDPARLLALTVERCAELAASYMAAGFVHGVLNTDNINVTGESFDYGPWRFAPTWDLGFTAAYFDHSGLYAFGRQPEAIYWNLGQFASALRLVAEGAEPLVAALESYPAAFQRAVAGRIAWRLGRAAGTEDETRALARAVERTLRETGHGIDRFFHDSFAQPLPSSYGAEWDEVRRALSALPMRTDRSHPHWSGEPCSMLIDEVEAIWAPITDADNWSPFQAKIAAVRRLGEALG